MEEYWATFKNLKKYLETFPLPSKLVTSEVLYLYLAISPFVVSLVLVQEEGQVQKLIYYMSKVLHNAKTSYSKAEKMVLTLLTLEWYFDHISKLTW